MNFLYAIAVLGYLSKLKRGFALAFSNGQSFHFIPFLFLKISNNMYYEVIILVLIFEEPQSNG